MWLKHWAEVYEEASTSSDVIHEIYDTFFLVAVVDDDFVGGDIFGFFDATVANFEAKLGTGGRKVHSNGTSDGE